MGNILYDQKQLVEFLYGLPFVTPKTKEWFRIPPRIAQHLSNNQKRLAENLSGGILRFTTKATQITLKYKLKHQGFNAHFSRFGQSGIDIYVNGRYIHTFDGNKKVNATIQLNSIAHPHQKTQKKNIELYLPLYAGLKDIQMILDAEAEIMGSFSSQKPFVYYGSSITQGGCAGRPGTNYQAQLHRMLPIEFVNFGMSGNGLGEPIMAEMMAELDATAYILDWGANLIKKGYSIFLERYEKFYQIIREKHPTTPIIFLNLQTFSEELYIQGAAEWIQQYRTHVEKIYRKNHENDGNLYLVSAAEIITPNDMDCLVDGTHPNDMGFQKYAEKLYDLFITNKIGQLKQGNINR